MHDAHTIPAALMERAAAAVRRQQSIQGGGDYATVAADPFHAAPALLAEAGLACLHDAIGEGNDRRGAFALLTADALITAACEAAVDGALPDALSARRFAALLQP